MEPLFIIRRALLTLCDGSRIMSRIQIPPHKVIFLDQLERTLVKEFNRNQPHLQNKVVKIRIMRN
jgi:hypothetical protein